MLLKDKIKLNSRNPDMADEDVLGFKLRDTSFQIACDTFKSSVDGSVADDQVPLRSFAFFGAPNRVLARNGSMSSFDRMPGIYEPLELRLRFQSRRSALLDFSKSILK